MHRSWIGGLASCRGGVRPAGTLVLSGEQSIRSTHGVMRVQAGQAEAGHGADHAMQVSGSGAADFHALAMFVVDANKPFSSPAVIP